MLALIAKGKSPHPSDFRYSIIEMQRKCQTMKDEGINLEDFEVYDDDPNYNPTSASLYAPPAPKAPDYSFAHLGWLPPQE